MASAWSPARCWRRTASSPSPPAASRLELKPERDGSTTIVVETKRERAPDRNPDRDRLRPGPAGGRQRAELGASSRSIWRRAPPTPADRRRGGTTLPQFHELLSASGATPVRALIASLDGCAGGRAGEIVAAAGLSRMAVPRRRPRPGRAASGGGAGGGQAGQPEAPRRRRPRRLPRQGLCDRLRRSAVRFAPARRHPRRGRGLGVRQRRRELRRRQRQPHADRRRNGAAARQERHQPVRLRASPHRRQGAQGAEIHRLAQRHRALHADHLRRQGAGPAPRSWRPSPKPWPRRSARSAGRRRGRRVAEGRGARPSRRGDRHRQRRRKRYRFNARQLFYRAAADRHGGDRQGTARSATSPASSPTTRPSTAKSR